MADPQDAALPFPPREYPVLRADSVAEEYAYLGAWPAASGPWKIGRQTLVIGRDGPEDHLILSAPGGEEGVVRFAVGSFYGSERESFARPGTAVDEVMKAALDWELENEPAHPGSMPRFPVPAEGYPGRVAVPFVFRAADDERRAGLYGPTRAVILGWPDPEIVGATDAPGFDPVDWPPPRLGPWPPPGLDGISRDALAATVGRFTGVWTRLLDAFLRDRDYYQRQDEAAEALLLLGRLDPPPMTAVYRAMSPRFWSWLTGEAS